MNAFRSKLDPPLLLPYFPSRCLSAFCAFLSSEHISFEQRKRKNQTNRLFLNLCFVIFFMRLRLVESILMP